MIIMMKMTTKATELLERGRCSLGGRADQHVLRVSVKDDSCLNLQKCFSDETFQTRGCFMDSFTTSEAKNVANVFPLSKRQAEPWRDKYS